MSGNERAEYVATIANQATVMSDVLENLLVSAQTEMGILSVVSVPVNLGAQLSQVIERVRTDSRCVLRVDGTAAALGDPERVRQIIRNLRRTRLIPWNLDSPSPDSSPDSCTGTSTGGA